MNYQVIFTIFDYFSFETWFYSLHVIHIDVRWNEEQYVPFIQIGK